MDKKGGIPKEILKELELDKTGPKPEIGRLIVEKYQAQIKLPRIIRDELNLEIGSLPCVIQVTGKDTLEIKIGKKYVKEDKA